jgi:hypothetical protein
MAATLPARSPRTVPRDMTRADICNVEPLSAEDFEAIGFEDDGLESIAWTLTEGGASWAE